MLRPTRGLAEVDGINVVRNPEGVRSRIGFMSCNTGIYDRMTAWEMVEYYGRLYGIPEEKLQARITEIFNVLQMNEIRDRLGGKMTGMKQKVSIARTIVHDPPVIIFDEPTSGLDVLVARAVLQAVASLRDQGKCIIFSTHIMREVEKLCNRIGIIHRGKILAEGTLPELADKYQQPDVEELFFDLIQRREEEVRTSGTQSEAWILMRWKNATRLVFLREVRDQLRDRRTLFMITILPVLLYPMLGLGIVEMMLTFSEQPHQLLLC